VIPKSNLPLIGKALTAGLLAGLLLAAWPAAWLAPVARLAAAVTPRLTPWIESLRVQPDGYRLEIAGDIRLGMILADGSALPALPGTWSKHGGQTLVLGLVALTAWAMIPGGRRHWLTLPVVLCATALAAAFVLAIEIQQTALQVLGHEWLPRQVFADAPANHAVFARLQRAFVTTGWIQSFHDAGGRLFYGLLAGWIALAWPTAPRVKNEK
jgi:hypothetical protein